MYCTVGPGPPQNVGALVINSTTVEVTWDPPSITNGILRYYTIVYVNNDNMKMLELNSSDVSLGQDISGDGMVVMEMNSSDVTMLVSGLDSFTSYTFYVLAVTVVASEPSDGVTVLTDEAGTVNIYYFCIYDKWLHTILILKLIIQYSSAEYLGLGGIRLEISPQN